MVDFLSVMDRRRFEHITVHHGDPSVSSNCNAICITLCINIQTVKTCKHWAQCSVTAAGTAQCACIPGTSGARCENGPCKKTPCLNSGTCLVMGIHAINNIGFEDAIGLRSKIFAFPAYIRFTSGLENLDLLKLTMIRTGKSLVINVNVLMGGLEVLEKLTLPRMYWG